MTDLIEIPLGGKRQLVAREDDLFAALARYQELYGVRHREYDGRLPLGYGLMVAFAAGLVLWLIILFAAFELIVAGPWG